MCEVAHNRMVGSYARLLEMLQEICAHGWLPSHHCLSAGLFLENGWCDRYMDMCMKSTVCVEYDFTGDTCSGWPTSHKVVCGLIRDSVHLFSRSMQSRDQSTSPEPRPTRSTGTPTSVLDLQSHDQGLPCTSCSRDLH